VESPAWRSRNPSRTISAPGRAARSARCRSSGLIFSILRGQELIDFAIEILGIHRRVTDQFRANGLQQPPHIRFMNQSSAHEGPGVGQVLPVASLDLGQGLSIEVVMPELYAARTLDEKAALFPAGKRRNELVRSGQLDVYLER